MKKAIILIILFLSYNIGHSQIIDVDYSNKEQSFVENEEEQENPVEVL
jgi:hypothetical protein